MRRRDLILAMQEAGCTREQIAYVINQTPLRIARAAARKSRLETPKTDEEIIRAQPASLR